jgi:hypothetical protein
VSFRSTTATAPPPSSGTSRRQWQHPGTRGQPPGGARGSRGSRKAARSGPARPGCSVLTEPIGSVLRFFFKIRGSQPPGRAPCCRCRPAGVVQCRPRELGQWGLDGVLEPGGGGREVPAGRAVGHRRAARAKDAGRRTGQVPHRR